MKDKSFSVVQNTTFGACAVGHAAQVLEEAVAVHHGHVPVEQDHIRHLGPARQKSRLAVLGFCDPEIEALDDLPRNFSDDS